MATYKISQLPAVGSITGTEYMEVDQLGVSKKATVTQILSVEATIRAAADTVLQGNITSEATSRTNADAVLQSDINTRIKNDGTIPLIADWATGGYKLTGLAAGTTNGDSVRYEQVLLLSGATAALSMGGFKITNLGTPSASTDAATMGYVLAQTINTLTAPTSNFSMNSHQINSLLDPTSAQDAVTVNYLKLPNIWNTGVQFNSAKQMYQNNTLVGGTDANNQFLGNLFNVNGAITLGITATTNKNNNFNVYTPDGIIVNPASTYNIGGGQLILGPGIQRSIKVEILNGFVQGFYPIYTPSADSGLPDLYKRWISVPYDFGTNGGGTGTISLNVVLPDDCFLLATQAIIEVTTAFTSGGSATIAWGITASTTQFDTATAFDSSPYTTANLIKVCSSGTNTKLIAGANKTVTITIAVAALTGGAATIHIPVLLNNI